MLLSKQIQILVFVVNDQGVFDNIGEVNQFNSLIWPNKFNGYASFELWAPITSENSEFLKTGNVLWCGGDNAAIIEIVKSSVDDKGVKTYNVKGRTLEALLTTRIVWGTHNAVNKYASTVLYDIVTQNCIDTTDAQRKIPFLECAADTQIGGRITVQRTGGEVHDACVDIAGAADIGFNVQFKPHEKKMVFQVVEGVDRTIEQSTVDPVEFSTDLEDILSSLYYTNNQDEKSVALVLGEGTSTGRKREISGNNDGAGFLRKELYVDARDIQSETISESGVLQQLTPAEYADALMNRGDEKLSGCQIIETFEAQLRIFGGVQYEFGVDYQKGDKVTVRDEQLNVVTSARITEIEEMFSDEYALVLTFGSPYITILQKVKQTIS